MMNEEEKHKKKNRGDQISGFLCHFSKNQATQLQYTSATAAQNRIEDALQLQYLCEHL
jgi:hypothetical protein